MEENTAKYNDKEIYRALEKMSPELKWFILPLGFESIFSIANSPENAKLLNEMCDKQIEEWNNYKKAANQFLGLLDCPQDEDSIENIVECYKRMNREERFILNHLIEKESNLQNKVDNMSYNWKVFRNNLQKMICMK